MKKLFLATKVVKSTDVIFVSNSQGIHIEKEAINYLYEQEKISRMDPEVSISIAEITSVDQIPEAWRHALIWGIDDELTAQDFLDAKNSNEYKEYLRLKAKFE